MLLETDYSRSPEEQSVDKLYSLICSTDRNLGNHCQRVQDYAGKLAELGGVPYNTRQAVKQAALIHDLGKIEPEFRHLLNDNYKATFADIPIIQAHPKNGADRAFASGVPTEICWIIQTHHEDFNGGGYPFHLQGNQIGLEAQILHVADCYDAARSRRGISVSQARNEILSGMGAKFDPRFYQPFVLLTQQHERQRTFTLV